MEINACRTAVIHVDGLQDHLERGIGLKDVEGFQVELAGDAGEGAGEGDFGLRRLAREESQLVSDAAERAVIVKVQRRGPVERRRHRAGGKRHIAGSLVDLDSNIRGVDHDVDAGRQAEEARTTDLRGHGQIAAVVAGNLVRVGLDHGQPQVPRRNLEADSATADDKVHIG